MKVTDSQCNITFDDGQDSEKLSFQIEHDTIPELNEVTTVDSLNDRKDFDNVRNAMKVLGYTPQEIDTVSKLIAAILHLIKYFNNKIICDLVEQQHSGVIALLDEACFLV